MISGAGSGSWTAVDEAAGVVVAASSVVEAFSPETAGAPDPPVETGAVLVVITVVASGIST